MNNTKTAVDENFVIDLTTAAKTHEEWLSIVRFGMSQLIENQPLLAEVICREAGAMAVRDPRETVVAGDFIAQILLELKLKLELK